MELALSENGEMIVASHGTTGFCPLCGKQLIPRCGPIKIDHWAHKGGKDCDPWGEGETPWHRHWKKFVDKKFREVVIVKDGIKHRADIKLYSGIIFEFQRKPLPLDDRKAREEFYEKMVWVLHFPKEKILETGIRKKYQPTFGDSLINVKGFSQRYSYPPHPVPLFLDFDDGEMFWIKEFDDYGHGRTISFYGKFLTKMEFVNQYLENPFFWDIDELKISQFHRDYKVMQEKMFDARRKLDDAQEGLRAAKEEFLIEKRRDWFEKGSEEWYKANNELRKFRYDVYLKNS